MLLNCDSCWYGFGVENQHAHVAINRSEPVKARNVDCRFPGFFSSWCWLATERNLAKVDDKQDISDDLHAIPYRYRYCRAFDFLTSNASNASNAFLYRKQMKMMLLQGVGKQSMARVGSSLRLFFTKA